MSHLTKIDLQITDLEALKSAVVMLEGSFHENRKTFKYYNNQQGHSDHVISFPGALYEIGVVRNKDGTYGLQWDSYSPGGLTLKVGPNANRLKQRYGLEKSKRMLRKKGFRRFKEVKNANSKKIQLIAQR